jgi:CBS-domain-containing membrane protein
VAAGSYDRLERLCQISSFVAVPVLLAILTETQHRFQDSATSFLVLPPFAVVIYLIFREPFGNSANLRSIVLLPCIGAIIGQLCFRFLGFTPLGIAVDTLMVLAIQSILRARMPPALALSVLALLLHVKSLTYTLGVFEASVSIAIVFFLWRRFVVSPLVPTLPGTIESTLPRSQSIVH